MKNCAIASESLDNGFLNDTSMHRYSDTPIGPRQNAAGPRKEGRWK